MDSDSSDTKTHRKHKKKSKDINLPNQIIPIPNADKNWHESWDSNRNMANFPHPFRMLLLAPPNTGKTTLIKNILIRSKPRFKRIILIHCSGGVSHEYDDLDAEIIEQIPAPTEFDGKDKTLVILEDINLKEMPKEQRMCLDRLMGYVSTHCNVSVCLCNQDFYSAPPICRKLCNVVILGKVKDRDQLGSIAKKAGCNSDTFKYIMENLIQKKHDTLCIDMTTDSPYPLRKNLFENLSP